MNKNKINLPIFVPNGKEDAYFNKNNILYKELSNGIKLIGSPRIIQDEFYANIRFFFNSGSYNDPPGKKGIHHLFEHLLMNRIQKYPKSVDIYKNAYTSQKQIVVESHGTANPNVKKYGIWPMIPNIIASLKSPIKDLTEKQIENEIKIVLQEIAEKNTDPDYHAYKFMHECIYSKINPMRNDVLGNDKDLKSITIPDLKMIIDQVFVPKGLTINTLTHGGIKLAEKVIKHIENEVSNFPRTKKTPLTVNIELEEQINPNFKFGNVYFKDDGLKNKLVNVAFVWIFSALNFTPHAFALTRFIPLLHDDFLAYSRTNGLGYSSYVTQIDHKKTKVVIMSITLPKETNINKIQ